jgi:hypothetical protein
MAFAKYHDMISAFPADRADLSKFVALSRERNAAIAPTATVEPEASTGG